MDVSTNIQNERPAMAVDENSCVYIVTRYLPGGSGMYRVIVYKKCPDDGSFTAIPIHQETLYMEDEFIL